MTAEVDFPAPPLGFAKTMVGMVLLSREIVEGRSGKEGYQIANPSRGLTARQRITDR
jgi:hypothetical protein